MLDVRALRLKPARMEVRAPHRPLARIAGAIGVSRVAIYRLRARHGLSNSTIADPEALFDHLVAAGRSGKLRAILSDPRRRNEIAAKLI